MNIASTKRSIDAGLVHKIPAKLEYHAEGLNLSSTTLHSSFFVLEAITELIEFSANHASKVSNNVAYSKTSSASGEQTLSCR